MFFVGFSFSGPGFCPGLCFALSFHGSFSLFICGSSHEPFVFDDRDIFFYSTSFLFCTLSLSLDASDVSLRLDSDYVFLAGMPQE